MKQCNVLATLIIKSNGIHRSTDIALPQIFVPTGADGGMQHTRTNPMIVT